MINRIAGLKKKRKAIILAHNYQRPEIQDIADVVGDSLGLSIEASKTDAQVILFCGVYFMAETAKILSPGKTVLIPDKDAGCPLAEMITADELKKLKRKHPKAKVLCYVNTSAEVKAEADLCCTSANAVKMINGPLKDEEEIIFVPDKYLAHYVSAQTGRKLISWYGYCSTHVRIMLKDVSEQKWLHPKAEVMVHPECTPEVIALADAVLSTEGMCRYVKNSKKNEFIVGTEKEITYRLSRENPDKLFYPAALHAVCPNMKRTTLEKVLWALEDIRYEVVIRDEIIAQAQQSIKRMVEYNN